MKVSKDGKNGWIEAELKGMRGLVPDYQVFQREPIIVYICRNDNPRIVPKNSKKVFKMNIKSRLHRTNSAPSLTKESNDMVDSLRRNSDP